MKQQKNGYSLVELLIVMAIIGVAAAAIFGGIYQIIRNTETNSNRMTVVMQVQATGNRVGTDVHMAQVIETSANLTYPDFLFLKWIDAANGNRYEITYTFEDMDTGSGKNLMRNQSVNGTDNVTMFVSNYIDYSGNMTTCNFTDGIFNLTVTATAGGGSSGRTETRLYRIFPRPG